LPERQISIDGKAGTAALDAARAWIPLMKPGRVPGVPGSHCAKTD